MAVEVAIQVLPHGEGLDLPQYQTAGSAGCDLVAAVRVPILLDPLSRAVVPTGLCISLPRGWEAQVRPRSGWAVKHGITVINSPGTIDSDYRGEVKVALVNLGGRSVAIRRGERVAQLVLSRVHRIEWAQVESLDPTSRGGGGFGSTGR